MKPKKPLPASRYNAGEFKEWVNARPFRPFRATLYSGKIFEVPQPDAILVTQHFLRIGIDFAADGIPRRCVNCPIFHIANVEVVEPEKAAKAIKQKR